MIPTELQDTLQTRLQKLFEHETFISPSGGSAPLSIFKQRIPRKKKADDQFYPMILIKLFDGGKNRESDENTVNIGFVIGTFDEKEDNQGYRDVTHIMNKILKDLKENPSVNGQFDLKLPLRWALLDEEPEPYFYGGIEASFIAPEPQIQPPKGMEDFL